MSNETVFVKKIKHENFTVVDNGFVRNEKLSWKAKGILLYLISLPDDWILNQTELKNHSSDGISSLRSGLDELKDNGYLKVSLVKDEKGHFSGTKYEVDELGLLIPNLDSPILENLKTDNLKSDNRNLLNTDNNQILNLQNSLSEKSNLVNSLSNDIKEKDKVISELNREIEKIKKTKKSSSKKTLDEKELDEYWSDKPADTRKILDSISMRMYQEHNKTDPKFIRKKCFILNQSIILYKYLEVNFRDEKEMLNVFNYAISDSFWHDKAMIIQSFLRNYETILVRSRNFKKQHTPAFEDHERHFDMNTEGDF